MTAGIYIIQCTENDKVYVGSSKNIEERWKQHIRLLQNNSHHSKKLQGAWNKYGEEAFAFLIIEEVLDLNELTAFEQKHIDDYNSFAKGYNSKRYSERNASNVPFSKIVKISVNLNEEEHAILSRYCVASDRTKNDILREYVRSLATVSSSQQIHDFLIERGRRNWSLSCVGQGFYDLIIEGKYFGQGTLESLLISLQKQAAIVSCNDPEYLYARCEQQPANAKQELPEGWHWDADGIVVGEYREVKVALKPGSDCHVIVMKYPDGWLDEGRLTDCGLDVAIHRVKDLIDSNYREVN